MTSDNFFLVFFVLFVVAAMVFSYVRSKRRQASGESIEARAGGAGERSEAYFRSMFPELQPHFHPEKVLRFVRERYGSRKIVNGYTWRNPPGFETAAAVVVMTGGREGIRLLDAAGVIAAEFDYEQQPSGGALRVGRGKLTVVLQPGRDQRVRYWHPEREFKWSRMGGWQFTTPVAERSIDSDDRGSRWSNDSRSSSSSWGTAAAAGGAAALVSGAGGAFAGGGASDQWDAPVGAGNASDAAATAY